MMKNILGQLISFFFIGFILPCSAISQNSQAFELRYEVNPIYPSLSISKEKLTKAHTLSDLNSYYQASWIKEYIAVEVLVGEEGRIKKASGKNDTLTQVQKDLMNSADMGMDITVKVQYLPENTLANNEIKTLNFSFLVNPENEATYPGGRQKMEQYFEDKVMDKIATISFKEHHLTAVKFTIDEEGQVSNTHLFESSKDERIDALLLEAISNMPKWTPASYGNGEKVKQEFTFTIGDHKSCVINLLNIRRAVR